MEPSSACTEGFDIGLEMSGAPKAFDQMVEHDDQWRQDRHARHSVRAGRRSTGIRVIFKSLTIKGIYGREMFETWYKMIALVQGPLDVSGLITHRIAIDDYQAGFEAMRTGSSGKVVMDW
jgi:threonine 3-dehydrogenase